jgi:NADPH:quinone reductase-like Zn-dependent oxidoreductase
MPGQTVVLLGATGGVGSYATQLAAAADARVVAVTRGAYAEYARSLGADEVIDYEASDAIAAIAGRHPDGIDALIDLAGVADLVAGIGGLVRHGGHVMSVVMAPDVAGLAERGVTAALVSRYTGEPHFDEFARQIASGDIRLPALQAFTFDDVGAALELQATRHVHGKLTVQIAAPASAGLAQGALVGAVAEP